MSPASALIYAYTRAQALEDGVLVDVSVVARSVGIGFPVAMTRAAWELLVQLPSDYLGCLRQGARLFDVLMALYRAIQNASRNVAQVDFKVTFDEIGSPRNSSSGDGEEPAMGWRTYCHVRRVADLKALCGPGDSGEPVITVMLPEED
jgi:hypothetical protein